MGGIGDVVGTRRVDGGNLGSMMPRVGLLRPRQQLSEVVRRHGV